VSLLLGNTKANFPLNPLALQAVKNKISRIYGIAGQQINFVNTRLCRQDSLDMLRSILVKYEAHRCWDGVEVGWRALR